MGARLRLRLKGLRRALRVGGSRTLLAISTVGLGIAAMMIMLAVSSGARRELETIADKFGKNLFVIAAARVLSPPGREQGWFLSPRLKETDAALLLRQIRSIRTIVPVREGSLSAKYHREDLVTSVRGVTPAFLEIRDFQVVEGRPLEAEDGCRRSRVAVVGRLVVQKLNAGFSMVGKTMWIAGIPFEVVGELKEKGINNDGQNEDDQILIPLETALRRVFNADDLSRLLVQVDSAEEMAAVQAQSREILRMTHALDRDAADDFDVLKTIRANEIRTRNRAFLEGMSRLFAAITVSIGGVGVLSVTFLNVKERTPEIGLRIAVGARARDIVGLFVAEACCLSGLGGAAGLAVGASAVVLLKRIVGWQMALDVRGAAVSLLVSLGLGLLFGVAPAFKASRVTPVDALRDL
ncbi:MAG: ABC transporter permease [Thermoanaerobaculia bacterium]